MTESDDEELDVDFRDSTKAIGNEQKRQTFRKRRLSIPGGNIENTSSRSKDDDVPVDSSFRIGENESSFLVENKFCQREEQQRQSNGYDDGFDYNEKERVYKVEKSTSDDEKVHTFRKRRLSLTSRNSEGSNVEVPESSDNIRKRHRKGSEASVSSLGSADTANSNVNYHLKSRILHSSELPEQPPLSPNSNNDSVALPKLYQEAAPPRQQFLFINGDDDDDDNADDPDKNSEQKSPIWKKRHTWQHLDDDKNLPFPRDIVGTYSCHGVEPICCDSVFSEQKLTMAAKTNQDRGGVAYPYGRSTKTALFAVYDGHGQGGELISQYSLHEIQRLLEIHPDFNRNIKNAFKETFLKVDNSLKGECLIEPVYAGTTACVALLRHKKLVLSNVGDSRAVLARRKNNEADNDDENWDVIDLTEDQNPDVPVEQERIERMGGFVSPPPEPGLSSRVWLDKEWSQIGLAMSRSIGDHAVKPVGVIAEPVVSFHDINENDAFLILATDGVFEFISSAHAVEIVANNIHKGATKACQKLIEAAAAKWHDEEGDYRDDITALVIRLQNLWKTEEN